MRTVGDFYIISFKEKKLHGLVLVALSLHFVARNAGEVDGTPRIHNVGQYKGDNQADGGHGAERKFAGAAIRRTER